MITHRVDLCRSSSSPVSKGRTTRRRRSFVKVFHEFVLHAVHLLHSHFLLFKVNVSGCTSSVHPQNKSKGKSIPGIIPVHGYSIAQILTHPVPESFCSYQILSVIRYVFLSSPPIDILKSFSSSLFFDSEVEKSILSCLKFPIKYQKQEEAAADLHLPTRPTLSPT